MQKKNDTSTTYNSLKEFEGKRYTGMKVGRTHHWYYDKGDWKEKKVTPEKWELTYSTMKRRAGRAPKGSGVQVPPITGLSSHTNMSKNSTPMTIRRRWLA